MAGGIDPVLPNMGSLSLSLCLILQAVLWLVLCDLVVCTDDSDEEGLSDKATLATVLAGVLIAAFTNFGDLDSKESVREGKTHWLAS
jgi:hypothetical protein